jgi:hypothetical protein
MPEIRDGVLVERPKQTVGGENQIWVEFLQD